MSELVRDLGLYLVENGQSRGLGNDLFLNYNPDSPDNVVVLTEYSSSPSVIGVSSLVRRVQVLVRNSDYQKAYEKIWSIYNFFIKEDQFILQLENRYLIPKAVQSPLPLMVDDKERQTFVFNLSFTTTKDFN